MNVNVTIELKDGSLFVFGDRKLKCRRTNTFYVDDMSVEVTFIVDSGACKELIIGEKDIFANRRDEGTSFVKIS